ncbi:hypothetical protein [Desulfobulbus alkaliphilus]|uniref:hypothetical protein n=1 Tax=Desulfobulbus alkaliphilus TaxID=869814 RepID=UPI0019634ACB|nr:hypothetical protein [Desulfobulbus alkaliphilus]MBM9536303.1 hypothetical protein [Desulfobulbus alkaliphilus]
MRTATTIDDTAQPAGSEDDRPRHCELRDFLKSHQNFYTVQVVKRLAPLNCSVDRLIEQKVISDRTIRVRFGTEVLEFDFILCLQDIGMGNVDLGTRYKIPEPFFRGGARISLCNTWIR